MGSGTGTLFRACRMLTLSSKPINTITQLMLSQISNTNNVHKEPYSLLYEAKFVTKYAKEMDVTIKLKVANVAPALK